jgi:hypothetical protein
LERPITNCQEKNHAREQPHRNLGNPITQGSRRRLRTSLRSVPFCSWELLGHVCISKQDAPFKEAPLIKLNMRGRLIRTWRRDFGRLDRRQNNPLWTRRLGEERVIALWLSRQNRKPLRYFPSKTLSRSHRRKWPTWVDSSYASGFWRHP